MNHLVPKWHYGRLPLDYIQDQLPSSLLSEMSCQTEFLIWPATMKMEVAEKGAVKRTNAVVEEVRSAFAPQLSLRKRNAPKS